MNKYLNESEIVPYHTSPPVGEKALVLAPHPDDETLGCGGTIRLLVESKKNVKVLFLTSGDKADPSRNSSNISDYILLREKEAEEALGVLGVSDYEFLRFPDRGLIENYEDVLKKLSQTIKGYAPDTIYSTSMIEPNPDHRAVAEMAIEFLRIFNIRVAFYEGISPLRPNILSDITSVYKNKSKAIKKYRSQLKLFDYLGHFNALNKVRALTVKGPRYAEAFWVVDSPLSDKDITEWLGYQTAR